MPSLVDWLIHDLQVVATANYCQFQYLGTGVQGRAARAVSMLTKLFPLG